MLPPLESSEHVGQKRYVLIAIIGSFYLVFDRDRQEVLYCYPFYGLPGDSEWFVDGDSIDCGDLAVDLEDELLFIDSLQKVGY